MAELTPEEFLDTVLVPEKSSDHICWNCRGLKLVHEDPLAPLLVCSGFQRGQEVLCL
jgi:hypothetical protein